jgi:hypothetical protein
MQPRSKSTIRKVEAADRGEYRQVVAVAAEVMARRCPLSTLLGGATKISFDLLLASEGLYFDLGTTPQSWSVAMRKSHSRSASTGPSELGRHAFVFDDGDVIELLKAAVEREGNQVAFARRHGLDRTYLNMVLNSKRPLGDKIIDTLKLRKVYTTAE